MRLFVVVLLSLLTAAVQAAPPSGYCDVKVCNKLERFTLSPFSAIKDKIGEQCFNTVVSKDEAVVGKILDSSTRWYHGSFNPTKKSVTRVKQILACSK